MCFALHFLAFNAQAQEKVYRAAIDGDGVQRVQITGGSYYYEPNHIIVKLNVPVELTFKKDPGIAPHNILIKAPEAGIDINEDMRTEPVTVTFTPVKTGKFAMYCDKRFLFFKNHREKGMEGILEVVE
jgi:plastocyanin domain-containing protein